MVNVTQRPMQLCLEPYRVIPIGAKSSMICLLTNLRPTLYLAQQTQLLAGNISIVHKVTGGSRTYKGEGIAGVQIVENAVDRIKAGQGDLFLVGAANNAARPDLLIGIRELHNNQNMWDLEECRLVPWGPFWSLKAQSMRNSAGAKPYAKILGTN